MFSCLGVAGFVFGVLLRSSDVRAGGVLDRPGLAD